MIDSLPCPATSFRRNRVFWSNSTPACCTFRSRAGTCLVTQSAVVVVNDVFNLRHVADRPVDQPGPRPARSCRRHCRARGHFVGDRILAQQRDRAERLRRGCPSRARVVVADDREFVAPVESERASPQASARISAAAHPGPDRQMPGLSRASRPRGTLSFPLCCCNNFGEGVERHILSCWFIRLLTILLFVQC